MTPQNRIVSQVERLLFLKTLPGQGVDSQTLGLMAAHLTECTFNKGDCLIEPGRVPERFYMVVDGEVEVLDGTGRTFRTGSRSMVGMLPLMARDARGIRATALQRTLVLEGRSAYFLQVLDNSYTLARHILQGICEELVQISDAVGPCALPFLKLLPDLNVPPRRLDIIEKLAAIRRTTRVGGFNMDGLMELSRRCQEIRPQPGEVVWKQGEPSRYIHLFVQGKVDCLVNGESRFEAGCGHHLENLVALAGLNHRSEGRVSAPAVLLRVEAETFFDILEDRNTMITDLMSTFAAASIEARALVDQDWTLV